MCVQVTAADVTQWAEFMLRVGPPKTQVTKIDIIFTAEHGYTINVKDLFAKACLEEGEEPDGNGSDK